MAMSHNCIQGSFTRPVASELERAELVINQTDGTLWTKRVDGEVIRIEPFRVNVDRSWKFIDEDGQPSYENGFQPVDNRNPKNGIGYRLFDNQTLQITGRVKTTRNLSRGSHSLFTFGENISQRLVGLNHQHSIATISPTLNAGQYVTLNVNGHLDLNIFATIFTNDEVLLDCYFQLN